MSDKVIVEIFAEDSGESFKVIADGVPVHGSFSTFEKAMGWVAKRVDVKAARLEFLTSPDGDPLV